MELKNILWTDRLCIESYTDKFHGDEQLNSRHLYHIVQRKGSCISYLYKQDLMDTPNFVYILAYNLVGFLYKMANKNKLLARLRFDIESLDHMEKVDMHLLDRQ